MGIALAFFLVGAVSCFPQEKGKNMDAAMKKWMEAATPGEGQKKLEVFAGRWEATSSVWVNGSEKPPAVSKGTAEVSWALGGRFLRQQTKGEMMGNPTEGIGYMGYDNVKKQYSMFWIDNSSTAMYTAQGTFDTAGTTLTLYGTMDDPVTEEHGKQAKYVYRWIDANKYIFEFHDLSRKGSETKVGEIVYTKVK